MTLRIPATIVGDIGRDNPKLMSGQPLPDGVSFDGINIGGSAQQVATSTITATTASDPFQLDIYDSSANLVVSVAGTTQSTVSDAAGYATDVLSALQADEVASSIIAWSRAAGVLTQTTRAAGVSYDVNYTLPSSGAADFSDTTAAGNPSALTPGRALLRSGVSRGGQKTGLRRAIVSAFSAQVKTFTYTSVASGDSVVTEVQMVGRDVGPVRVVSAFDTNQTTTLSNHAAALETELNAIYGAGVGAVATSDATTVVITADIAGDEFTASSDVQGTGGGTVSPANTTGPSAATSLRRAFAGVCEWRPNLSVQTAGGIDGGYGADEAVPYCPYGQIPVYCAGSPVQGAGLWVNLASGAPGQFDATATAADSPVWLGDIIRVATVPTSANGVVIVQIDN